jgi:hypothetical protein
MWPHFPLEFAFVFIERRLAFWHADLPSRMAVLKRWADIYESLADGEMAAVYDIGGRRNYFNSRRHRFWELAGYTTRAASENQYFNATGWWRCFDQHIKCTVPEERGRRKNSDTTVDSAFVTGGITTTDTFGRLILPWSRKATAAKFTNGKHTSTGRITRTRCGTCRQSSIPITHSMK